MQSSPADTMRLLIGFQSNSLRGLLGILGLLGLIGLLGLLELLGLLGSLGLIGLLGLSRLFPLRRMWVRGVWCVCGRVSAKSVERVLRGMGGGIVDGDTQPVTPPRVWCVCGPWVT